MTNSNSTVTTMYGLDERPFDKSWEEWTAIWWNWAISVPRDKNPLIDETGKYCGEGQNGPVWFLAGTSGNTYKAERRCNIPSERAILFPIIASQFSYSEAPHIRTDKELI